MQRFWHSIFIVSCLLSFNVHAVQNTAIDEIAEQVPKALRILNQWHSEMPQPSNRRLHFVYWTPSDREPASGYRERLTKILLEIQAFYRNEMLRMGFGNRTIQLDLESDGMLKIPVAIGTKPYTNYHVQSGNEIRRDCVNVLAATGIDADKETIVIFCNMSNWDADKKTISQNSPYYASGSLRGGTAWQVDSPILDLDLLDDKSPVIKDGQYREISIGRYNSIFIGGIAHEVGHALSLPHNLERPDQRKAFATALMGSGNRTYGDERRGEGRGSFITLAHGLRLAAHPIFSSSSKGIDLPANARLQENEIEPAGKAFTFRARVSADPPCYAVIGYMDPSGGSDYDATTCTAIPDENGRFNLECNALRPDKAGQLRIVALQANGGRLRDNTYSIGYEVSKDGQVDLSNAIAALKLEPLEQQIVANDAKAAARELLLLQKSKVDAWTLEIAESLVRTLDSVGRVELENVEGKTCRLGDARWSKANVGWGRPAVDRLPGETAIVRSGGKLFAHGLYAHAPSSYVWDLNGKWQKFKAQVGLADGHEGSVVFVVYGDDKELWRSPIMKDSKLQTLEISVSSLQTLELQVENAGDGNSADWGLWLEPVVSRN